MPAGFLLLRFPARVQLPPFAWKRLGQLFLFTQEESAMPYASSFVSVPTSVITRRDLLTGGQQ